MFGDLIYFDKNKVKQYMAIVLKKPIARADVDNEDSYALKANYLLMCQEFEETLKTRDDYYDFTEETPDVSIKDIKISSIVKVRAEIYVPESFDMVHLIDTFKGILLDGVDYKNEEEKELIKKVLDNSKIKIPIFCELGEECDYWMGIGKASPENMLIEYNDLEDYECREVTVLAKIESRRYYKDTPLKVFDIYKDFLGLNRTLRKQIVSEKKEEYESIDVSEDFISFELLAIY